MAKAKKRLTRKRGSARSSTRRTPRPGLGSPGSKQAEVEPRAVTMRTIAGKVEVPAALANRRTPDTTRNADVAPDLLDLTHCEAEFGLASPGFAGRALVEGERVDPRVVKPLARGFPMFLPMLTLYGDRGRLLAEAPTLRRVRRIELHSGDTHAALVGMVYGLPMAVLAEFENGTPAEVAAEELAGAFERWDGRLLILLVALAPGEDPGGSLDEGRIIAPHEVDLERPVL